MSEESTARGTRPPGPSGLEWLGLAGRFGREDLVYVLERVRDRHGPTARLSLPGDGRETVLVTDPVHVERVLEGNRTNYRKAAIYREELSEVFGDGLLTSEGELWRRQNRTIAPMFTHTAVERFGDLILAEADAMVDRWLERAAANEPIDLLAETERATLLVIGKALFSEDMADRAPEMGRALAALRASFKQRTEGLVNPPSWLPTRTSRRADRAREYLDETVHELIAARRASAETPDDLLSRLLAAEDAETGERMADEQVRDEVVTFLLAGHETTAAALAWTWYLLARHPAVHRRLYEHVADSPLGAADPSFAPEMLAELGYVGQVVREGMRLYPPVPHFAREAVEADRLGEYRVPEGARVLLSQYLTQRDPRLWEDPSAFDPSRFAPGWDEGRPRYSYYPFGGGPRTCTGRAFALLEAQLILGRAVARCRLELAGPRDRELGVSSAVTMTPDPHPRMDVHPREGERRDGPG